MSTESSYSWHHDRAEQLACDKRVIEVFREAGGLPNQLLLHTRGRKSGIERVSPLKFLKIDSGWVVFGTGTQSSAAPGWYYNIKTSPRPTKVELGDGLVSVRPREVVGNERAEYLGLWNASNEDSMDLVAKVGRDFPVLVLEGTLHDTEWQRIRNASVIEEVRASGGKDPRLLIHHKGRRSGVERVTPVACRKVDSGWAVFATYVGAPRHPDWYFNLVASPRTKIEVGGETIEVIAREASGNERNDLWARQMADESAFAEYEERSGDRVIPVIIFEHAE